MKISKITFEQSLIPYKEGEYFEFKEGINLLVGDQGAGKSTLMEAIRKEATDFKDHVKVVWDEGYEEYIFLDCEQHNPRVMSDSSSIAAEHKMELIRSTRDGMLGQLIEYFKFKSLQDKSNSSLYDDLTDKLLEKLGKFANDIMKKMEVGDSTRKAASTPNISLNDLAQYSMRSHGQTIIPLLESFKGKKNSLILIDEPETALSIRSQYKVRDMIIELSKNNNQIFIATHSAIFIESVSKVLSLEHRQWMKSGKFIKTQKTY